MKTLIAFLISITCLVSCAQQPAINIPLGSAKPGPNESVAYFAEGCFWHAELVFQSLVGVRDAVCGYAGGSVPNPSYEQVCSEQTGHAETVQVFYDTTKISYQGLVRAFFASMDPTELNRQGNDMGASYRSIAFYTNPREKATIDAEIKRITDSHKYGSKIVTEVKPFSKFYPAEAYHQEYIHFHPDNPYVAHVSIPEYEEFRKDFKEGVFKN